VSRLLKQSSRLVVLALYVAILCAVSWVAQGSLFPPLGAQGLWFYSGLAALLLGSLLSTPHYPRPADSLAYGVAALVALVSVGAVTGDFAQFLKLASTLWAALVVVFAAVAIGLKDATGSWSRRAGRSAYVFAVALGRPGFVFVPVYAFALVAYHSQTAREYVPIALAGVVIIGLQPVEGVTLVWSRLRDIWSNANPAPETVGEIVGHLSPGLTVFRTHGSAEVGAREAVVLRSDGGRVGLALTLDNIGYSEGTWLRAMGLDVNEDVLHAVLKGTAASDAPSLEGDVLRLADAASQHLAGAGNPVWDRRNELIGLVAPGTDVAALKVELLSDLQLRQGQLLEAYVQDRAVMYQVMNGVTCEEILERKSTHGFVRVDARKIGHWDDQDALFKQVSWLPEPNSGVYAPLRNSAGFDLGAIGHFPGTDYRVSLNLNRLVAHNTAILGILGVGKSCLSMELVERLLADGIKVVCLDPTSEYGRDLGQYVDAGVPAVMDSLRKVGEDGRKVYSKVREEGGSCAKFKQSLKDLLRTLLDPAQTDWRLLILNPAEFEVWRQIGNLYKEAEDLPMAQLTPPEVTQLVCEACLETLQDQGVAHEPQSARCCVVLEEAHTLAPERGAAVVEGDKAASNGTARAIIQGRKYGFGCLLVTQRTANVTKTLLNQCNTVFAMRSYDATGAEFLSNYIGEDYVQVLNALEDRHAIVFGKASRCHDPVLLELNDRSEFVSAHREAHPTEQPKVLLGKPPSDPLDDGEDIPF
jgi:hypothetical protein